MGLVVDTVSRVVRFPIRVGGGGIAGIYQGVRTGTPDALPVSGFHETYDLVRDWLKSFIGGGCQQIAKSGLLDAYGKREFSKMWGILADMELKGLSMLGIYGVLAGVALYWGTNLALTSWHKVSEAKKGYPDDVVRSPLIHGAHAFTGLAMAGGVLMLLHPATFAAAAPTIAAGFTGSLALHALRSALGGRNWFRYDEGAPWPLNLLFRKFRNNHINYNG